MDEVPSLLAALQHADGQFPSGGFAFSWGLEGLFDDGRLARTDLQCFIEGQLRYRWATFDRPILAEAFSLAEIGAESLRNLDSFVNAWLLAAPQREGSRRSGVALLGVHANLGTKFACDFQQLIRDGMAIGHVSVVQGLVWRGIGFTETACQAIAAYSYVASMTMAAVRLGAAGHLDAQRALTKIRIEIASILKTPPLPLSDIHTFAPVTDIAMLTHARKSVRLFSN